MTRSPIFAPLTRLARGLLGQTTRSDPTSNLWPQLSQLLGIPPDRLRQAIYAEHSYHTVWVPKRAGSTRQLAIPSDELKAVQRALLRRYLAKFRLHPAVMGFRPGHSIVDHARAHQGQAVVAAADLADFFGSTAALRVRAWFAAQGWKEPDLTWLTRLCTWRDALPQGAPTSPALSNLVNYALDTEIATWVTQRGGRYTRYGDDLAFSWARAPLPYELESFVRGQLISCGYQLNPVKGWRVWHVQRGDRPCLTGVYLEPNGDLHPAPAIQTAYQQLRATATSADQPRLRGYAAFLQMFQRR